MLQINPFFSLEFVDNNKVFVISEKETLVLRGKTYFKILSCLPGSQLSEDELLNLLTERTSPPEIYFALNRLREKNVVIECKDEYESFLSDLAFYKPSTLRKKSITIITIGNFSDYKSFLHDVFQKAGFVCGENPEESRITLVIIDHFFNHKMDEISAFISSFEGNWLFIKPTGLLPFISPVFGSGTTNCWPCLKKLLAANKPFVNYHYNHGKMKSEFKAIKPTAFFGFRPLLAILFREILKWLSESNSILSNHLICLDIENALLNHNKILTCECSDESKKVNKNIKDHTEIKLVSRLKLFTGDGGHRAVSPDETLKRLEHFALPLTGLMSPLHKLESGNNGFCNSYITTYYPRTSYQTLDQINAAMRANAAFGKGITESQAKASAMCEAIERYCGHYQGNETKNKSTYLDLKEYAIHPSKLLGFSKQQYLNRATHSQDTGLYTFVPLPFNDDSAIDWTAVWSLNKRQLTYIPTAFCYYDYPEPRSTAFCLADSNGCASGNNMEEAILQGYLELIERDCVGIWWYNMLKKPMVDIASFDHLYINQLVNFYDTLNREIWVLDITSDFGVTTFVALSKIRESVQEHILLGFGSHLDPVVALLRSITELEQSRHFLKIDKSRKDEIDKNIVDWVENASVKKFPYLLPDNNQTAKKYTDYDDVSTKDIKTDVETLIKKTENLGLETLVLNLSRKGIDLSVVKVIVPGLCHFWPRFGYKRLYEVPVKLGWLEHAKQEDELNNVAMFL